MIHDRFPEGLDPVELVASIVFSDRPFLPAGGQLDEDYVALLDDLHSMPMASHSGDEKLFTLSMAGFYLFAFKLSVHFCRLHEKVDRRPEEAA